MARRAAGLVVLAIALNGCSVTALPGEDPTLGPTRTSWTMRHDLRESAGLKVVDQAVGTESESTGARVGKDDCSVSIVAAGGPDNMVGRKIETTFAGRPAIRNGAGAEVSYLM